jgi:phenylacetic acid degradation protein
MNAVIMDNVDLGDNCIVGALSLVKAGEKIPPGSMLVGNPAKIIKQVSDEMIQWKKEGTKIYQQLAAVMQNEWKPCEPLRDIREQKITEDIPYKTWGETKGK